MKAAKKISFRAKIRKTMLMTGIVLFLIMVLSNFFNYSTLFRGLKKSMI